MSLEDGGQESQRVDEDQKALHGDVAAWVGLCNSEKTSSNQFVFDEVGVTLYFEEDLGLRDVLRGDGGPGFETDEGIHLRAGAERLVKGNMEGALVFCCRTEGVKRAWVGRALRWRAYD